VTDRRVALLRGINVGRAKRISMGDLRALFAGLGYGDVKTLLNSGNIVFTVAKRNAGDQADRIEREVARLERRSASRNESLARQFDRVLGVLSRLPFGAVEEFRP